MHKCEVNFYERPSTSSPKGQDGRQVIDSFEDSEECFVSLEDYHLSFFSIDKEHKSIYQVNVRNLSANLDSKGEFLAISSKKSGSVLLEIHSDIATLDQIENYCHQYSDESLLWNLLVFSPHNTSKQAIFSDRTKTSSLRRIMSRLSDVFCLMMLIVIAVNFQYVMEGCGFIPSQTDSRNIALVLQGGSLVLVSLILMMTFEKLAFKKILSKTVTVLFEAVNICTIVCAPIFLIRTHDPNCSLALMYSIWSLMIALKMISYMHFMHELRKTLPSILSSNGKTDAETKKSLRNEVSAENLEIIQKYANNISGIVNLRDITYFLFTPALVYQLWYPKTGKIHWGYVARLSVQFVSLFIAMFLLMNKYMMPSLEALAVAHRENSPVSLKTFTFIGYFLGVWVIQFFCFFHVFLTLLAEALRFGDQEFYKDWWNSRNTAEYWNKWNRPVHKWAQRHIHFPLQKRGYSKVVGLVAVFIFSGALHEYLYCVPTGIFGFYVILWFLLQPIAMLIAVEIEKRSKIAYMIYAAVSGVLINYPYLDIMIIYYQRYMDTQ